MPTCIYCQTSNTVPSIEHVVAEGLGGCLKLPAEAVCKACNNRVLGDEIDVPVRNDLMPILVAHRIVGKSGEAPIMTVAHDHPFEGERRYRVSQADVSSAERRKLVRRAGNTYEFRADSPEELEKVRSELQTKHRDKRVELSDVEERPLEIPVEHLDEVDFTAEHWSRWAAKTCINLIAFVWGAEAARAAEFDGLRAHVVRRGAPAPDGLVVGGCGSETVNADETPPQHRIEVKSADGRVVVTMTAFAYGGFKYDGPAPVLAAKTRTIVLDAISAKVAFDSGA